MLKTAIKLRNITKPYLFTFISIGGIILLLSYILYTTEDWSYPGLLINLGLIAIGIFSTWVIIKSGRDFEITWMRYDRELQAMKGDLAISNQYTDAFFRITRELIESEDEEEIINFLIDISTETVDAVGASYVPLDERNQPMASISKGELPFPIMEAWIEYLATPAVRERCGVCDSKGDMISMCPLLNNPTEVVQTIHNPRSIYCLPLNCNNREIGILNLYMPTSMSIPVDNQKFLRVIADETALAIERVRLRNNQLDTLHKLHGLSKRTEIEALLASLVNNVHENLESDFVILHLETLENQPERNHFIAGDLVDKTEQFLNGFIQSVMISGESLLVQDIAGDALDKVAVNSIIAVPLVSNNRKPFGVLLAGQLSNARFHARQIPILKTIASHMVLVIENARAMAQIEYKSVIDERTRLAREIHDGLAQTLGLLKLQAAQTRNYLVQDDKDRANTSLNNYYRTLSEAYHDAREAIDNLRINPFEKGVNGWLSEVLSEFQEANGIETYLKTCELSSDLRPEIHAQIIRVVQEALSNVRKHAEASIITVNCFENSGFLIIEIIDNGKGFAPEDISSKSRHGLRGMRERAELINADFQIISHPNQGTIIRLELPIPEIEDKVS